MNNKKHFLYNCVLKGVPLPLMDEIRKYHKHHSVYFHRWKMRKPIPGEKYGWGGSLKRENATAADLYVDLTPLHHTAAALKGCREENYVLRERNEYLERAFTAMDRRGGNERRRETS